MLASLTFKEAACGFPLVALAALGTNRRARGRRAAMLGLVAAFVAGVVALHNACLSKTQAVGRTSCGPSHSKPAPERS